MDRRIRRTIEFLEQTEPVAIDVRDLAERVNLSRSRLEHLFKRDVGWSITRFVLAKRLARATQLIAGTDLRISRIGELSGFRDPANFDHAFKRAFGMCPRDYRRRLTEKIPSDSDQQMATATK